MTRPAFRWCVGTLVLDTWSGTSLPHFEGAVCYGCNRATAPDATPLNYGDWLPAGAVSMHCHACHWCDPSSARLSIAIARQLSQSFSVDSDVVIASALVQRPLAVAYDTSRETEETSVPSPFRKRVCGLAVRLTISVSGKRVRRGLAGR